MGVSKTVQPVEVLAWLFHYYYYYFTIICLELGANDSV